MQGLPPEESRVICDGYGMCSGTSQREAQVAPHSQEEYCLTIYMYTPLKQRTGPESSPQCWGLTFANTGKFCKNNQQWARTATLCADFLPPGPHCHLGTFPCAGDNLHPQNVVCKELGCCGWHWLLLTHIALGCSCVGHSPTTHCWAVLMVTFPLAEEGRSPKGRGWCLVCLSGIFQSCVTTPSVSLLSSKWIKHSPQ